MAAEGFSEKKFQETQLVDDTLTDKEQEARLRANIALYTSWLESDIDQATDCLLSDALDQDNWALGALLRSRKKNR